MSCQSRLARKKMAQKMLSFFDEKYLLEDCLCEPDKGSNGQNVLCSLHHINSTADEEQELQIHPEIITINQSWPKQPTSSSMLEALEYRIKVKSYTTVTFQAGETVRLVTNINIGKKTVKYSLLSKPPESLDGFRFLSEGYINPGWKGRLTVSLQNSNCTNAIIPAGTVVAFLILSPFIQ